MFASSCCRSFFRVDRRVLQFVNSCPKHKPFCHFQVHSSYCSLSFSTRIGGGGAKDRLGAMEKNKKRKPPIYMWRPVSTQASSVEENLVKDATIESGDKSSPIIDTEQVIKASETVTKVVDSTMGSSPLKDNVEDGAFGGETMSSAEKHSISLEVGHSLFRFIRGKSDCVQNEIEKGMAVKILFPSSKDDEAIVIEGSSHDDVLRASEKIRAIIDEAVKSPNFDYSHFISLPLAIYPELVDKLVNFQKSIVGNSDASLAENSKSDYASDASGSEDEEQELSKGQDVSVELKVEDDKHVKVDLASIPLVSYVPKPAKSSNLSGLGIDKSIFINPKTFHLTVLMLKLWNKERVNAASEVLKNISSKVVEALDNQPLSVRLTGLACMKGSLAKARVLYATVEEIGSERRLLRACQVITDAFVEAGLVLERDATKELKLHTTVMNVRHRKGKAKRRFDSFDARGIFKQFGSYDWGEYLIREAHLSQRFVYDDDGYYHCCAKIPFPESMQDD